MKRPLLLITMAALALIAGVLTPGVAHAANRLDNPGFETGDLTGWDCGTAGTVVTTPVHDGGHALAATATATSHAGCRQTVPVQPGTAYTLSAWVRGAPVYLGVTGGASTWTNSPQSFTALTVTFTTGATQTSAEVYLHGWYGAGTYHADDVVLDGPDGGPQEPGVPRAPGTPTVHEVTDSGLTLRWSPVQGEVTGYRVHEGDTLVATVPGTSVALTGLAACTSHTYRVTAYNDAGKSARSAPVTATTLGCADTGIPRHALIGYLHSSFANGSGYVPMSEVPAEWDIVNLAFGEPTTPTSGDIRFQLCPVSECPGVETEAEFTAAIAARQAQGKKVLISIGGANGQVQLTTTAARDKFVQSVSAIIDRYGLDGLDIDFEGHSLYLNPGDTDFRNPTTPVVVNLISALRTLKNRYGDDFVLTMAPETFFVQVGHQFYGGTGTGDNRTGAYLPVIHAMRDALNVLQVQHYNSGPVMGLDGRWHTMGGADFHIAMADMVKAGFTVANTGHTFPGLREDQIAVGLPAAVSAGNGHTPPAQVHQALDCLVKGTNCGGYTLRGGTSPALRGLMTWSINWDRYYGWEFQNSHRPYLDSLP
ncbi:chitinase [Stackebrandtia albiflava]|uniref:chitinase n=1 Tax=Stackebrandtia albiflava TaxID=406432 RepID=A0A562VAN3_9ACTN|nr:glycoside hydrolase family 18 protein [Stackebrandtia albiflava]TWJ14950.1 chitinase [Stackebrandtia albiflava]